MSAAQAINKRVYVEKAKYKTILCFNWSSDLMNRITIDEKETNLWVVPLGQINIGNLEKILKENSSRFNKVIGVQPTGWTLTNNKGGGKINKNGHLSLRTKDRVTICSVPYSEHSSFNELISFIRTFK